MKINIYASVDRHEEWGGNKRYVRVVVYEDLGRMRSDAFDYSGQWHTDCVGLYHPPITRWGVDEVGKCVDKTDKYYGGTIRLHVDWLTYEVVTHECAHAAATIWRLDVDQKLVLEDLKKGDDFKRLEKEEKFCYLVGNLTGAVMNAIKDNYVGALTR